VNEQLAGLHGLLVAPGFGARGIEGKIVAVKYARENNLPFFLYLEYGYLQSSQYSSLLLSVVIIV
jgi:CTP synthase (UTP-ammonia lyase)